MRRLCVFLLGFFMLFFMQSVRAAQLSEAQLEKMMRTIEQLKRQVQELETRIKKYEAQQKKVEVQLKDSEKLKKELEEKAKVIDSLKEALGNIRVGADITVVGQGTVNNDDNNNRDYDEGDVQDAAWSFDLEVESQLGKGAKAYLLMEGGQGEGVDDEVPTLSGFNDDAPGSESARAEVTEAWYEQELSLGMGKLIFTLGKIDLTNYFDTNEVANDETTQFLSSGFVNNLAVEWPDDNGPGFRMSYEIGKWCMGVGFASADGDWEDLFEGVFGIAEVGREVEIGGLKGHYRVYAWYNGRDHLDVDDVKRFGRVADMDDDEDNYGVGLSMDQELVKDVLVVFLRVGWENGDAVLGEMDEGELILDTVPIDGALSLGFRVSGLLWGREDDELGLAYGVVFVDDEAEDVYREAFYGEYYRKADKVDMKNEHHVELYYRASFLNGRLEITPDVQFVVNPNGNGDADTVYVIGTRMQVNF